MEKYIKIVLAVMIISFTTRFFCQSYENNSYFEIVQQMGYTDIETKPYEITDVDIPSEFNDVYIRYNEMLKKGGYDLTSYRGKRCKRYTYLIPSENARANILVYNKKIIGGDISGITLDGIMVPIKRSDYSAIG